jgi:hypothetical protein
MSLVAGYGGGVKEIDRLEPTQETNSAEKFGMEVFDK